MDTQPRTDGVPADRRAAGPALLLGPVAAIITISALLTSIAHGDPQRGVSFQVPRGDLANAEALGNRLAALSPRVDPEEAKRLAQCAYATVSQLRHQYRMFGTPMFNNFLVYYGMKKRGYCYQWAEDLLLALDSLKLKTLELHWGEAHAHTWRENNCVVATARGQSFDRGVILECWEHFGHLQWGPIVGYRDTYVENAAYARFIRAGVGQTNARVNRPVAFQTATKANKKSGD